MSADLPVAAATVAQKRPEVIASMFDAIARRYDLLNHLLSGGLDWYWRWRAIRALRLRPGETLLDLCTGTGDVVIGALRRHRLRMAIGVDFASEMLRIGKQKLARRGLGACAPLIRGDATRVPLSDASVDAVTMAFGIRNVESINRACLEMARVLKAGGRLAVLEFAMPQAPLIRQLYAWYFRTVLPRIGRFVSRHGEAYTYLPHSVSTFSTPEQLAASLEEAGFTGVRTVSLTLGVVQLYVARRAS